jgi:hypothetical protein
MGTPLNCRGRVIVLHFQDSMHFNIADDIVGERTTYVVYIYDQLF